MITRSQTSQGLQRQNTSQPHTEQQTTQQITVPQNLFNNQFQNINPLAIIQEEQNNDIPESDTYSSTILRRMSTVQRMQLQEQPIQQVTPQQDGIIQFDNQSERANQDFLDQEQSTGDTQGRPSRNQRIRQVEQDIQRLQQQFQVNSAQQQNQIQSQQQSFNQIIQILNEIRVTGQGQNTQVSESQQQLPQQNSTGNLSTQQVQQNMLSIPEQQQVQQSGQYNLYNNPTGQYNNNNLSPNRPINQLNPILPNNVIYQGPVATVPLSQTQQTSSAQQLQYLQQVQAQSNNIQNQLQTSLQTSQFITSIPQPPPYPPPQTLLSQYPIYTTYHMPIPPQTTQVYPTGLYSSSISQPQGTIPQGSQSQQIVYKLARQATLKNYNGEDKPERWLASFRSYCEYNNVPVESYLFEAKEHLTGRALSWYERNVDSFLNNFDIFVTQFKVNFFKDAEVIETQLLSTTQNYEESLRDFLKRLENIAKPASLDERRIRQAFLMGIRDYTLKNYAQQQYLYQNNKVTLEQIIPSLQFQEQQIKFAKRSTTSTSSTTYKPTYRSGISRSREYPPKGDSKSTNTNRDSKSFPSKSGAVKAHYTEEKEIAPPTGEGEEEIAEIDETEEYAETPIGEEVIMLKDNPIYGIQKVEQYLPSIYQPQNIYQNPVFEFESENQEFSKNMFTETQQKCHVIDESINKQPTAYAEMIKQINQSDNTIHSMQIAEKNVKTYNLNNSQVLRYINIKVNNILVSALVDTGCTSVVCTMQFVMKNYLEDKLIQRYKCLTTVTQNSIKLRDILPQAKITFSESDLSDIELQTDMLVVPPSPSFQVIVGQSFLNFFSYQVAASGLYLRRNPTDKSIFIPYVADMIYQISESDLDQMGVLFKHSINFTDEQHQLYPEFPKDKRDIILMDPPWAYFRNYREIEKPKYKQLTYQQLCKLPVREISKEDGILLMWVTGPMFRQALSLITAYGYMFKTILFVWVKLDSEGNPQKGKGNYTLPCCEYLVMATKGNFIQFIYKDISISQLLEEKNFKNSKKPKKIYQLLTQVFKLQEFNNLEIFSTCPEGSELFSHYGDQVPGRYKQSYNISKEQYLILSEGTLQQEKVSYDTTQIFLTQEEFREAYEPEDLLSYEQVVSQIKISDNSYQSFLTEHCDIFSRGDADLGETDLIKHEIVLQEGSKPLRQRPYRKGKLENDAIKRMCQEMLDNGIIQEEPNPYQHPIVLVKKPSGKYRMCINFKYLNSQTVDDKYPIPLIKLLFSELSEGTIFSKLDGKSGFWQVSMDPTSIPLTGFVSESGQYVFKRMPFGLKNAPATFQRLMNTILKEFIGKFVIVYIDDVIVYSPDHQTHKQHLKLVFNKIRQAKIKLGADKCEVGSTSMDILGHTVSRNKIQPQQEKVKAIKQIATPQNVTELRSFLGLCSYYRQYIPNFAQIANCLYPLIGKNSVYKWDLEKQKAFEKLKDSIAENSVLHLLQNDRPLVLYTDFSIVGIGAVLAQKITDRKEKVIEYASRTLQKYERSLDSYCGEVLAVYWAVNKFRQYILSIPYSLEIVTDNKALEWVLKLGTSSPIRKIQRWTMEIDSYSYHVRHRKGTAHVNADALSRLVGQIPQELQPSTPLIQKDKLFYMEDVGDLACTQCKSTHENDIMVICDKCADANHIKCIQVDKLEKGPFYCPKCVIQIDITENNDIIYNKRLVAYLRDQKTDKSGTQQSLQYTDSELKQFKQYKLIDERIFKQVNDRLLLIPTEVERQMILKEQHHLCGHAGINRIEQKILEQYWWKQLHHDIKQHVKACEICNVTKPTFSQQTELHPIWKGVQPFQILATDLITNLSDSTQLTRDIDEDLLPEEEVVSQRTRNKARRDKSQDQAQFKNNDTYKHCIVVIDVFSKYVELGALKSKSSDEIYQWFDQRIICRYGSPHILRSDQGTEFMGGLKILCQDHNIEMRTISSHHPQANGQAEAMVKIVVSILRKFLLSKHYQFLHWWDILPYVQRSINISKTTATQYTPHEILYGKKINLTDSVNYTLKEFENGFPDISPEQVKRYVNTLIDNLQSLSDRVKVQLKKQDQRMQQQYQKKPHIEIEFQKGQRVYLQKLRTNKLEPRVLGPYIFDKYTDNKLRADVINPDNGKVMRFNTNTLSPASMIQFVYV